MFSARRFWTPVFLSAIVIGTLPEVNFLVQAHEPTIPVSPWIMAQLPESWQFERLFTREGRELHGIMLSQSTTSAEFAEIVRPRGQPMYAVIRVIPQAKITLYQPLEEAERSQLLERYVRIRHRAWIEARRMEDVPLKPELRGQTEFRVYDGPWFTMLSTSDDRLTRQAIVRLEQTFCAYRQVLPPRSRTVSAFQIYLYGSSREYREAQQRQAGWDIAHPAFYDAAENMVLAGSDLNALATELARVNAEHQQVRQRSKLLGQKFEESLAVTAAEMKRNGFSSDDVEQEIRRRRAQWNEQQRHLEKDITEAETRNAAKYETATRELFQRLQHEAFHAYLENYVYPRQEFAVPRWLNEGLAQVFEHAQLDADTLRVDTAPKELLKRLQADLRSPRPLSLAELVSEPEPLMAGHVATHKTERHYLYAWGLAYDLAFVRHQLGSQQFEEYVAPASTSPQARLEKWLGEPLSKFEPAWRKAMLELK